MKNEKRKKKRKKQPQNKRQNPFFCVYILNTEQTTLWRQ